MTYNNSVARLEIAETLTKDEGQYFCKVESSAGKTQTRARLFVEGEYGRIYLPQQHLCVPS